MILIIFHTILIVKAAVRLYNTLVKNDLHVVLARLIDMPQALPDVGNDCGKLREKARVTRGVIENDGDLSQTKDRSAAY